MSTLLSLLVDVCFTRMWGFNMEGRDMNLLLKNEQTNRQH